jgi:cysteine synthase
VIDLTVVPEALERAVKRAREKNIIIPTFKQQKEPGRIPEAIVSGLKKVGLWDIDPLNLFRITWHNEPVAHGGGFGDVNFVEFPKALTGVDARIVSVIGKWFPTGAHKVGAAFGCLVPRLVTGQFDPTTQKAVWPSTGNYCRGGAYDATLLGCESIAILPEGMSRERFEWLESVSGEIIKTPGSESNVKEIFDECCALRETGKSISNSAVCELQDPAIFNQFDEFGNYLWHHEVTGPAVLEVLERLMGPEDRFRGFMSATGSAGTIACGDFLKKQFPMSKIAASEALQCPTLLRNGFGEHRIEGIGDKHVPWIHNIKNLDFVVAVDDEIPISLMRLFNEPAGKKYLKSKGVDTALIDMLDLLGISGIGNLVTAIKFARYYELGEHDVVMTVLTDSMELYASRLQELNEERGEFTASDAAAVFAQHLQGLSIDNMEELTYYGRKRIHNLKYYTWVEQQGKTYEEIQQQWYDNQYWESIPTCVEQIDALIEEFNAKTGLLDKL